MSRISCTCVSESCPHQKSSSIKPACDKPQAPGDGLFCSDCRKYRGASLVADKQKELEQERAAKKKPKPDDVVL